MPMLATPLHAACATMALLVAMATCTDVIVPRVEPELTWINRRSLLGDLAVSVRDAAWPGDGGAVKTDAGRRLLEVDADALDRTLANGSLSLSAVTSAVLQMVAQSNATAGVALTQPLTSLDACLVWRRRPSSADTGVRDGMYFLTVFHSSVWSVLLLCLLVTVGLLTLLETAHPIGMTRELLDARKKARRLRQQAADKPMSPFHALAFAAGALMLMGYPRGPRATSGRVLVLFWWLFAFAIACAYLAATVLTFLTTRSHVDGAAAANATLAEVLGSDATGRVVMCSAGSPLCSYLARPEPLTGANFTTVLTDSAGLDQLRTGGANLLLLTHQFACANILAVDANHAYSLAMVAKATAWVSLVGPVNLVHKADKHIMNLLGNGQLARLEEQHGLAGVERYDGSWDGGRKGAAGVNEWLTDLRLSLPYRIGSMYGPLVLLIVGICLSMCSAFCEFFYYRFFVDAEEVQLEVEELEQKTRSLTGASTMDTYL